MRLSVVQGFYKLLTCRRSVIAITGMIACVLITKMTGADTSGSIALIVTSVAGANAAQGIFTSKKESKNESANT